VDLIRLSTADTVVRVDLTLASLFARPRRLCSPAVGIHGDLLAADAPGAVAVLGRSRSATSGQARLGAAVVARAAVARYGAPLQVRAPPSSSFFLLYC
jgi:hypothetical protein